MADVAGPSTGRGGGCGCGGVSIDLDRFVQHACGISRKKAKKLVQTGCVSVGGQVNMDRAHPLNEPTLVAIFDEDAGEGVVEIEFDPETYVLPEAEAQRQADLAAGKQAGGWGNNGGNASNVPTVEGLNDGEYRFVDTHIHLDLVLDKTRTPTWADYIGRNPLPAECDGVVSIYCDPAAYSPSFGTWEQQLAMDGVYGAFGIHPHSAKYYTDELEERIMNCLEHEKAVAWGECGLDFAKNNSPRDVQCTVFARQCRAAVALNLPLVIHSRKADGETYDILKENVPADWKMHLHCFNNSAEYAEQMIDEFPNAYFGFTGAVTFENAHETRRVAAEIVPLNRLLLETDGPYMPPRDKNEGGGGGGGGGKKKRRRRGGVATPWHIPVIAAEIADLRGVSTAEVLAAARENTRAMYGI